MRRRDFITLLSCAAAIWSFPVRAQRPERIRRVVIIVPATADDGEFQAWIGAFLQALVPLGWTIGRNLRIDTRWASSNASAIRKQASELATLDPDVILAMAPLHSRHCYRSPALYRSYSRPSPTRSALDSSIACRGRAATQPVS